MGTSNLLSTIWDSDGSCNIRDEKLLHFDTEDCNKVKVFAEEGAMQLTANCFSWGRWACESEREFDCKISQQDSEMHVWKPCWSIMENGIKIQ